MPDKNIPTIPYGNGVIYDPAAVPWVERDDFIKSLTSAGAEVKEVALEQCVLNKWKEQLAAAIPKDRLEVSANVARLARDYARYAKSGAKLPKFSRWASGMFPADKEIATTLAKVGQAKATAGVLQFSASCFDIMRCGVSPHFGSCFKPGGVGGKSVLAIASTAPGIGIVYVDDDKGVMKGRTWLYHAKRTEDDADIVVLAAYKYGTLNETAVVNALKEKGFAVYKASYGYIPGRTKIQYVNMGEQFYNDTNLWEANATASPL